jgi:hypothetical protein
MILASQGGNVALQSPVHPWGLCDKGTSGPFLDPSPTCSSITSYWVSNPSSLF